jgi:hypothetical protein
LSAGGGKSFSVRSSKYSRLSLLTPATKKSDEKSLFESSTQNSSHKSVQKSQRYEPNVFKSINH